MKSVTLRSSGEMILDVSHLSSSCLPPLMSSFQDTHSSRCTSVQLSPRRSLCLANDPGSFAVRGSRPDMVTRPGDRERCRIR
jgi:hypothetical protein